MSEARSPSERVDASSDLTYREHLPPPALLGVVECIWRREPWRPPDHDLGVLPDGRVDVIWASHGEVLVIGPQTRALGRPAPPDSVVVGIRFPSGVGAPLLGVPAQELANVHVALDAIDTRPAASLVHELATVESAAEAPTGLALAIARRAASSAAPDPLVRHAAALLEHPGMRVEWVAQRLSVSERRLQRRFRQAVGYEPKMLQRVLRFQRLIEALEAGREAEGGLARIAAMIGYSDQSHLTRECREFSGLRPLRLESVLSALKDHGASGIFKTGRRSRAIICPNGIGTDSSLESAPDGKVLCSGWAGAF